MICPCGQYEYIDSTAKTLADAMDCKYHSQVMQIITSFSTFILLFHLLFTCTDHREHGNRIIHEKLTGSRLFPGMPLDPREQE